jgi:predicted transcriptional regulator
MVRTSVILPAAVLGEINTIAQDNDVSAAWVMRHALTDFVKSRSGQIPLPLIATNEQSGDRKNNA